jgi:hypothetical protein
VLEKEARRGWVERHVVLTADAVTIRAPGSARALDTVRRAAPGTRPFGPGCTSARKERGGGACCSRCAAFWQARHCDMLRVAIENRHAPTFCGQPGSAGAGLPPGASRTAEEFDGRTPFTRARACAIHTGTRVRRQDETVSFHGGRRRREGTASGVASLAERAPTLDTPAAAPSDSNTVFTVCAPRLAQPMLSAAYASGAARLSAAGGPGAGGRWPTR